MGIKENIDRLQQEKQQRITEQKKEETIQREIEKAKIIERDALFHAQNRLNDEICSRIFLPQLIELNDLLNSSSNSPQNLNIYSLNETFPAIYPGGEESNGQCINVACNGFVLARGYIRRWKITLSTIGGFFQCGESKTYEDPIFVGRITTAEAIGCNVEEFAKYKKNNYHEGEDKKNHTGIIHVKKYTDSHFDDKNILVCHIKTQYSIKNLFLPTYDNYNGFFLGNCIEDNQSSFANGLKSGAKNANEKNLSADDRFFVGNNNYGTYRIYVPLSTPLELDYYLPQIQDPKSDLTRRISEESEEVFTDIARNKLNL